MRVVIEKGKHRPKWWWLRWPFYWEKTIIRRTVRFTHSCFYDIAQDQEDVNKLFGIGYFPNHHKDSARFGWNYDPEQKSVIIYAYVYSNWVRSIHRVGYAEIEKDYTATIKIDKHRGYYLFGFGNLSQTVPIRHEKRFGYKLGPYFGGNRTAPHRIVIKMKK